MKTNNPEYNSIFINLKKIFKGNLILVTFTFLSIISFSACKNGEKKTNQSNKVTQTTFKNDVLKNYIGLKNALFDSDQSEAASIAVKLKQALKEFDFNKFPEDQQKSLKEIIETATENTNYITKSNLEHQREYFEKLSENILNLIEITGVEMKVYQQYCPMYGDNGASWISEEENIRNPYMGEKMPTCGEVKKVIN